MGCPPPSETAMSVPVRFVPSFETIAPDELETEQGLVETLERIQNRVYEDTGQAFRGVHAKCHGIITGELIVESSLPSACAQGLFAGPGRYPAVIRLSTIPGDVLDDDVSVPRGLALKVIGVPGARASGSEKDGTQDFVLANGPAFSKSEPKGFLHNLKLLASTTDKAPGLKKALSAVMRGTERLLEAVGTKSGTVMTLGGYPEVHILGDEFYSQVPILFGDYMAKMRLVPTGELSTLSGAKLDLKGHPDGIRDAVSAHFRASGGRWALQAQLCTDLKAMPIEDAAKEWPQAESPYVTVAHVEANPQDIWSEARRAADATLSFSPWHAMAAHRPLGAIMRARRRAYAASSALRAQRSGHTLAEPKSAADLPA